MKLQNFTQCLLRAWKKRLGSASIPSEAKAIVLEDAKTIYVPVPKAANSSARMALLPNLGMAHEGVQYIQRDTKKFNVPLDEALAKADDSWIVFTIVREPYDRAHSAWRNKFFQHKTHFKPVKGMGLEKDDSFRTFLIASNLWPRKLLNDHFIPQADLIKSALKVPGFRVYRMEDINEFWPKLCDEIESRSGVRPLDMPHLQTTQKPDHLRFSRFERLMLRTLYGKDKSILGYE